MKCLECSDFGHKCDADADRSSLQEAGRLQLNNDADHATSSGVKLSKSYDRNDELAGEQSVDEKKGDVGMMEAVPGRAASSAPDS